MAYQDKKEGKIVDFEPQLIGGTIGGLDLIGGGAIKGLAKFGKSFLNTARQYAQKAFGKGKASQQTIRPLVTGNKVYDRNMINDAFAQRFGKPQVSSSTKPQNVISNATVDRATQMRNIERGYIGKTPRWAKPPKTNK